MKQTLVQILVVVANRQAKTLSADEEQGSVGSALRHGLVGPKR